MATPASPHAVPAGPLAVRWLAHDLPPQRAGATTIGTIDLENAGTAAWRSRPGRDIHLSYHWLDQLGNPIVWAGAFILLPERVAPGERISVWVTVRAPMPPGAYRLAFDLVNEGRYWFRELGNERLELDVDVLPGIARRALAVSVAPGDADLAALTQAALAAQEEPISQEGEADRLPRRRRPARTRLVAPHPGRARGGLRRRRRRRGRRGRPAGAPRRREGARPLEPRASAARRAGPSRSSARRCSPDRRSPARRGLPAVDPAAVDGPTICDGRIRVAVPARAVRPAGRPRA